MAEISLTGLSDKEVQALQEAITKRSRARVDFDSMTEEERRNFNRTVLPATPAVPWQEYPKTMYGNINGTVQAATVDNEREEEQVRTDYPNARWGTIMDHGIETCPSKPRGPNAKAFVPMGSAGVDPRTAVRTEPDLNPEAPRPLSWDEQKHPLARARDAMAAATPKKRGRPRANP